VKAFEVSEQGMPNIDSLPLTANVELSSGRFDAKWEAKVARISETVDPNQATIGVILEIDQNYRAFQPNSLPPLVNGMFVKARIEGEASAQWVIPESALHGDKIYLLGQDNKLTILPIEIVYRRNNQVVVTGDIKSNDRLILNDLLPAINGMQLRLAKSNNDEEPAQ
jgi:multidrug efflux pump subunit AcrA (membrane-fusion protein)